jgi:hypothetical protein
VATIKLERISMILATKMFPQSRVLASLFD